MSAESVTVCRSGSLKVGEVRDDQSVGFPVF